MGGLNRRRKRNALGGGGLVFSNIVATQTSPTTMTVTWTTSAPTASNSVSYGTTISYGSSQNTSTGNGVTSHSASITGLTELTLYHFKVNSGGKSSADQTIQLVLGLSQIADAFNSSPFQAVSTATTRNISSPTTTASTELAPYDSNVLTVTSELRITPNEAEGFVRAGTINLTGPGSITTASTTPVVGTGGNLNIDVYELNVAGAGILDCSGDSGGGTLTLRARKTDGITGLDTGINTNSVFYEILNDYSLMSFYRNLGFGDWDNSSAPTAPTIDGGVNVTPTESGAIFTFETNIPCGFILSADNGQVDNSEFHNFTTSHSCFVFDCPEDILVNWTLSVYGTGGLTTGTAGDFTTTLSPLQIVSINVNPFSDGATVEITCNDDCDVTLNVIDDPFTGIITSDSGSTSGGFITLDALPGSLTPETNYQAEVFVENGAVRPGTDLEYQPFTTTA